MSDTSTTTNPLQFEVYRDADGRYRWRLHADTATDPIIADSGGGYATRDGALEAISRLQTYVGDAPIAETPPAEHQQFRESVQVPMAEGGDD